MILPLILTVAKSIPLRSKWLALKLDTRRRCDVSEVIGGPLELKVAGPSMLGIGCPDRHLLPHITLPKTNTLNSGNWSSRPPLLSPSAQVVDHAAQL
jgi:hypothetical protein